jgi:hypothetical protein
MAVKNRSLVKKILQSLLRAYSWTIKVSASHEPRMGGKIITKILMRLAADMKNWHRFGAM